ncbi:hypothetical protein M569_01745, partial [Genlisea aurea]
LLHSFRGSQDQQQPQARPQEMSSDSWYHPPVSTPTSSRPGTPGSSPSGSLNASRHTDRANASSNVSPSEASGIIAVLKDKSVDDLRKLLSDKGAYQSLLLSLEPVKMQNKVRDELRDETLQITRDNLEKEPRILELRNQCRIIRTSELASAQEKLVEFERRKEEILKHHSPSSLLHKLQDAMNKTEEESDALHGKLLEREIDLPSFVQKYKKMRYAYHRQALTHVAAKTSAS